MKLLKFLVFFCCTFLATAQHTDMTTPNYLQKGDTIAILAPAGVIKNKTSIDEAVSLAESWGLHVVLGEHIFDKEHHFAGTDENRLADFQTALNDTSIKAIWCARGGYGTIRIIDDLNFDTFKKHPKWIIGYSDITVLHSHIHNLNIETLHAMMPVNMDFPEENRSNSVATFKKALFGKHLNYSIPSSPFNKKGTASGILVGGNLTLLENLLGTTSAIDTSNKILFIEEIGEYKYHIDRLLRALKRNNYFENCKGLVIGGMTHIKKNNPSFGHSIETLILEIVKEYDFPILFDFPAGHDDNNSALYLGKTITLKTEEISSSLKFK